MGEDVDNETIEASTIRIYPDLTSEFLPLSPSFPYLHNQISLSFSDQQISFSMEKTFREAFQAFAQETLNLFGQNPALAETPIAVSFCWKMLLFFIVRNIILFVAWNTSLWRSS